MPRVVTPWKQKGDEVLLELAVRSCDDDPHGFDLTARWARPDASAMTATNSVPGSRSAPQPWAEVRALGKDVKDRYVRIIGWGEAAGEVVRRCEPGAAPRRQQLRSRPPRHRIRSFDSMIGA